MFRNKFFWLTSIFFIFFFLFIFYVYFKQAVSFNFVDEYNNIVPAYFMLKEKTLYTDIFFNRQMLPAYISYIIQLILHPDTMYKLITYHRLFVLLFSIGMDIFLIIRFKKPAMAFVVVYELTKYYLFGFLFQAEAFIVYPLVYMFGIAWERYKRVQIRNIDYILVAVFTWFVIFMREPYIPLAIFLYFCVIITKKLGKYQLISVGALSVMSIFTLLSVNIKEYIYQMITVNSKIVIPDQANDGILLELLKSFGYPIYIFLAGKWNLFHIVLAVLSVSFIILLSYLFKAKKYKETFLIVVALGLAAVRTITPGTELYAGYRMLSWYSLLIFIIFSLLFSERVITIHKKIKSILIGSILCIVAYFVLNPWSYIWANIDKQKEFTINYSRYFTNGEVVKELSQPGDKLFIDGYDSLMYWQAGLPSSYKYTFFYPSFESYSLYSDLRLQMFKKSPPEFYYKECVAKNDFKLPDFIVSSYREFIFNKVGTCLYINRTKLEKVTNQQLDVAKSFGYELRKD